MTTEEICIKLRAMVAEAAQKEQSLDDHLWSSKDARERHRGSLAVHVRYDWLEQLLDAAEKK